MHRWFALLIVLFLGLTMTGICGCGGGGSSTPGGEQAITPTPIPDDGRTPSPPRNVVAAPGDRSATISWEKVVSAVGYHVYQSRDGVTFIRLTSGVSFSQNTAIIANLENDKIYYFGVSAVDERNNESGIAYVGGDGRNPKAFAVIPNLQYSPSPIPSPPTNFNWAPGDRKLLLTWDASPSLDMSHYTLDREIEISPFANVGGSAQQRELIINAYKDVFRARWEVPHSIANNPGGFNISGFTIGPGPFTIDYGVWPVGLPPSYFPLGLAPGDIWFDYEIWGWDTEGYSIQGGQLSMCVPGDAPPSKPDIIGTVFVPNASGVGVAVYIEWMQPSPPENSDIRQYLLARTDLGTSITVSVIVKKPFSMTNTIFSYQDNTVVPGKTYVYRVIAQDYTLQASEPSDAQMMTIPGGTTPEPEE